MPARHCLPVDGLSAVVTFNGYVTRYSGDKGVRTMSCAEQFRVMAFAQLTYGESLRDIEVSLSVQASSCTTWDFASRYGARRWPMPTNRATGASMPISPPSDCPGQKTLRQRGLGAGTVEHSVCTRLDDHRSVFVALPVGVVSHHQVGGEDAYAARFERQHPSFIYLSDGTLHDVHALDLLTRKPVRSTSWIVAM